MLLLVCCKKRKQTYINFYGWMFGEIVVGVPAIPIHDLSLAWHDDLYTACQHLDGSTLYIRTSTIHSVFAHYAPFYLLAKKHLKCIEEDMI